MAFRFTPETARAAVEHTSATLIPVVDRIAGEDRRALVHLAEMDRPALYFATFTDKAGRFTYVGMTGCAQHRPVASHLEGADRIYLISEVGNRLDRRDLMVLERSTFAWFEPLADYVPKIQIRPLAEAVGQARFAQLQLFLGTALLIIQDAGWEFRKVTAGDLSRQPTAYDEMARPAAHVFRSGGELVELDKCGATARAAWVGEDQGLILFPKSVVRGHIVPSAPKILGARREELVHTGHLGVGRWGNYTVDRMLWFPNLTSAGEFVTGSSATVRDWAVVSRFKGAPTRLEALSNIRRAERLRIVK